MAYYFNITSTSQLSDEEKNDNTANFYPTYFSGRLPTLRGRELHLVKNSQIELLFPTFSTKERVAVAKQALLLMEELYVHRDLKIANHGTQVDPLPLLRELVAQAATLSTFELLVSLEKIFLLQRDLHLSLTFPYPLSDLKAILPFQLKLVDGKNLAIQSVEKIISKKLAVGDIILTYNGRSPWEVIKDIKALGIAGNEDAVLSHAISLLTKVRLGHFPPPKEDGVQLTVRHRSGSISSIYVPWLLEREYFSAKSNKKKGGIDDSINLSWFTNHHGTFGLLRIQNFEPLGSSTTEEIFHDLKSRLTFINKFTQGLIIDLRDNSGGIWGDRLIQLFSPIPVVPQLERIRASELNLRFLEAYAQFSQKQEHFLDYIPFLREALQEGQRYTTAIPINSAEFLNASGRVYYQPVAIISNPNCYSYCDYFITSMQDHQAAVVWGENGWHTGGGGADELQYNIILDALPELSPDFPPQLKMNFAWSAGFRTGPMSGRPIEDNGATADYIYHTTIDDLLYNDRLLFDTVSSSLVPSQFLFETKDFLAQLAY